MTKKSKIKILSGLTAAALMFSINPSSRANTNSEGYFRNIPGVSSTFLGREADVDNPYKAPAGTTAVVFKQANGNVVILTMSELTPEQQVQFEADFFANRIDPSVKVDDNFFYIVGEGTFDLKALTGDKAWGTEYKVEVIDGIITITYQDGKISHFKPCTGGPTPTLPVVTPTPPAQDTPTPPAQDTPTPPAQDTPTPPAQDTPTPPAQDTPTPPAQDTPTPPAQDTPTPPAQDTPTPVVVNTPGPTVPPTSPKTGNETPINVFTYIAFGAAITPLLASIILELKRREYGIIDLDDYKRVLK